MKVEVDPVSRRTGYERQDADVRKVLYISLAFLLGLALSFAGAGLLLGWYRQQPTAPLTALERQRLLPPAPRLQTDSQGDGQRINQAARERLAVYAWVDRPAGLARLPIERAMDLLAERGWPSPAPRQSGETAEVDDDQGGVHGR